MIQNRLAKQQKAVLGLFLVMPFDFIIFGLHSLLRELEKIKKLQFFRKCTQQNWIIFFRHIKRSQLHSPSPIPVRCNSYHDYCFVSIHYSGILEFYQEIFYFFSIFTRFVSFCLTFFLALICSQNSFQKSLPLKLSCLWAVYKMSKKRHRAFILFEANVLNWNELLTNVRWYAH